MNNSAPNVSRSRSVTGDLVVDRLCDEFEDAWKTDAAPRIEDYLDRAEACARSALLQELLAIEIFHRQQRGTTIALHEYRQRFPELTEERLASVVAASGRFEVDPDTVKYTGPDTGVLNESSAPKQSNARAAMPARIGDYELLHEIARGGMGVVYQARQARLDRIVALKMILGGEFADKETFDRFSREASALAQLQHPNIVQIHEVNEHDGQPYFSLEFVEGGSLAQKLAGNPMPFKEAAALVETLASAIHAAHEKGIIHRDLKPANVLLTTTGVPKITDFGLAKKVDDDGGTRTGAIMGTPSYMAPEQASGLIKEVGPLADVYALGAILYETLTGRPPFKGATLLDTLEQVRSQEPVPPSRLQPKLPRDLETICLKCVQKLPKRRYQAACGLADDLRRFIDGRPITAQPVSRSEIAWRWCKRNPVVAGLFTTVVVLGVAVTTASLIAAQVFRRQRDRIDSALTAETKSHQAEKQAREHAMVTLRVMSDEIVENQMARDTHLSDENKEFLRTIIKHFEAFAAVTGDDAESRAIRAEGFFRVGVMRARLGELKEAEQAQTEALMMHRQLAGEFPEHLAYQQKLAWSLGNLSILFTELGRLQDAEDAVTEAIAIHKRLAAADPQGSEPRHDLAGGLTNLGGLLHKTGHFKESLAARAEAVSILKRLADEFPSRPAIQQKLAMLHANLGSLLLVSGRIKQAEAAYADAFAIFQKLPQAEAVRPETRQNLAAVHNGQAVLFQGDGRFNEAERAFGKAVEILSRLASDYPLKPEIRENLANTHGNLAYLFFRTGRVKEAEREHERAVAFLKKLVAEFSLPSFRWQLAASYHNLALLLRDTGRFDAGFTALESALEIRKQLIAEFPDDPKYARDLAANQIDLGNLLRSMQRRKETESAYAAGLANFKTLVAKHPDWPAFRQELGKGHYALGLFLVSQKRIREAESSYRDCLDVRRQLANDYPERPEYRHEHAQILANLGNLLRDAKRPKEAESAYIEARTCLAQLAADNPENIGFLKDLALCQSQLGILWKHTNRFEEAERSYTDALAVQKRFIEAVPNHPDAHNDLAGTLINLASLCNERGDFSAAKAWLQQAQPHHVAALNENRQNLIYRRNFENHLLLNVYVNAGCSDQSAALEAVKKIRDRGWDAAEDAYLAARALALCIPIVERADKVDADKRKAATQFYGDQAVAMLHDAVAKGFNDAMFVRKDTTLNPLRQRVDFKKLVAELNAKRQ